MLCMRTAYLQSYRQRRGVNSNRWTHNEEDDDEGGERRYPQRQRFGGYNNRQFGGGFMMLILVDQKFGKKQWCRAIGISDGIIG